MKRDMDLVREILIATEKAEEPFDALELGLITSQSATAPKPIAAPKTRKVSLITSQSVTAPKLRSTSTGAPPV